MRRRVMISANCRTRAQFYESKVPPRFDAPHLLTLAHTRTLQMMMTSFIVMRYKKNTQMGARPYKHWDLDVCGYCIEIGT